MTKRSGVWGGSASIIAALAVSQAFPAAAPEPIRDNSFLIEEAYNQEPGVVQHVGTYARARDGSWILGFTQEWPVASTRNQLSYTLNAVEPAGEAAGFGDVALHWRYQVLGASGGSAAFAPRVSVLLPFGESDTGLGAGGPGLQVNLPLSVELTPRFVTHVNAGATRLFDAKNQAGEAADLDLFNFGQSLVWLARPRFNALVEVVYLQAERVAAPGVTEGFDELFVSPGIRWAHDLSSGLQIVPGIAFPWGIGPSHGERGVFFYLSFEHAFRR